MLARTYYESQNKPIYAVREIRPPRVRRAKREAQLGPFEESAEAVSAWRAGAPH